jgi:anti-anti-sigma factor
VDLSVETSIVADKRRVLTISGSLDLASRELVLDAAADALSDPTCAGLVIDMSDVGFLDSSGIGVLVALAGEAEDSDRTFSLRRPSERVRRILELSGLRDTWPTEQ